jgi:hypothetical protein
MAKKTTKKKKAKNKTKGLEKKEYTDEEKARFAKHKERKKRKPVKFKTVESDSGNPTIELQDPDDLLGAVKMSEAFGTADTDLMSHLLDQIIQTFRGTVSADGADNDAATAAANKAMGILSGIQPRDELEGMLAAQMIGVHNMAMRTMGLAMLGGQTFEGKKSNVNYATKMLRTFMAQMEALKKYRTGGQQKMIVEHVHVNEGGQAIVGTVNQGGGENEKSRE